MSPIETLLGLMAHKDLIEEAKVEAKAGLTSLHKEWLASEHTGTSPGKELAITFSGESKITRVEFKQDIDTSNKTLMELLVLTAMNDALAIHQAAYDKYEEKKLDVEKQVIEKYEAILREREENGNVPKLPEVPVTDGNVMNFTDMINRSKAKKDLKKD